MSLDSVWHYTDGSGFQGIITRHVLWATSFRHLNDSQEAHYATKMRQEASERVRPELEPTIRARFDGLMTAAQRKKLEVFLLCAAQESNLLTVWRGYGGEVSYAVELDASVPLLPVQRSAGEEHPSPPTGYITKGQRTSELGVKIPFFSHDDHWLNRTGWLPVRYDSADAGERVHRIADLAAEKPDFMNDFTTPLFELGDIRLLQLKNPDFRDEREARMIFELQPRWKFVHHRHGKYGVTPYIEVSADSGTNKSSRAAFLTEAGRLPILSATIGPTPLGEEAVASTREFLEFNGYPDIPVHKSDIPFR